MPSRFEQADRGLVGGWRQHRSQAAGKQRHPAAPLPGRGVDLAGAIARRRRLAVRGKMDHGGKPRKPERAQGRRQRPRQLARHHPQPEQRRVAEHAPQQVAHKAVGQRALIGVLDMLAGLVDQVHVMHAGGTGGHAGQAGQAAVDMLDHVAGGRPLLLQHVLDQIDAPARAIELVAEQHIGRAGGGAEAAMHAGAQDLVGFRDLRIGELGEGEGGLHAAPIRTVGPDRNALCAARSMLAVCAAHAVIRAARGERFPVHAIERVAEFRRQVAGTAAVAGRHGCRRRRTRQARRSPPRAAAAPR